MILLLAAGTMLALAVPHRLDLDRVSPPLAATVWAAALGLRASISVLVAACVVVYLPPTTLFSIITHWCWHAVIPVTREHLPVNGHSFGDAAMIAPTAFLLVSTAWVAVGIWRAARAVQTIVRRGTIGAGPRDSVVLGDGGVVVAAAGIRRPRVVISAGALLVFDPQELKASLDHEQGHIVRHHRFVLLAAAVCGGLGRLLPGTRAASAELTYHLERDADAFALRRSDPAVLATALCKAASAQLSGIAVTALGGGSVARRVHHLLGTVPLLTGRRLWPTRLLAGMLVLLSAAAAAVLPAVATAGVRSVSESSDGYVCQR